ncbi:MAG: glycosyltransferase family 1 protein [Methylococcaceae bacterium]|nr:glycosyltransferase family 1 protein [Methylococcaceae bacterium]
MKIALISDAWHPQVNGIVTTLGNTLEALERLGHSVRLLHPGLFTTYPCPGYPDVGLAFLCGPKLRPLLKAFKPDAIHIATEGPVGYAARRYCRHKGFPYTSAFHSRFQEYLNMRVGFPTSVSEGYLRWFHRKSHAVMVSTESLHTELGEKGFRNLKHWPRGVDTTLFRPGAKSFLQDERPIFMYTGRVAVEKNLEDFLRLKLPGSKYVVGDGPQREALQKAYPQVRFTGYKKASELARYIAAADAFVFPSRTDTFGLVLLEALACGIPVAAYPVPGPLDVIKDERVGVLDQDLGKAAIDSLSLDPEKCRRYALRYSWDDSARCFVDNLAWIRTPWIFW